MQRSPLLSVFTVTLLAFVAAGCGSSPTSPSNDLGGARLNGQFRQRNNGAQGQSFYRAQTASTITPVTVVVLERVDGVKQEIASVPIVNGAFTIRGLPEVFFLRFLDAADQQIGEDMRFGGVKPNQEVDILVVVRNGKVVLLEESRTGINHEAGTGIEIEGTADVITDDGDGVSGSLTVDRYTVFTQISQTSIRKGNRNLTLTDIDGKQVHVRGVLQPDGTVLAQEIKLQDEEDEEQEKDTLLACDMRDPAKPNHILICHKGKPKSVSPNAWSGHSGHGDTCGPC